MSSEIEIVQGAVAGSTEVSLQAYQQVYNDLTGKSEHIRRLWLDAHVIKVSDLEQLHHRLDQCAEQYRLLASHAQVSVRYNNQESERFSSFEKFVRTGVGRSAPTEEIEMVYDFLIKLPKVQEAKPYRIELGFRSEVGVVDGFQKNNVTDAEVRLFHSLTSGKARMDISYVDIAVARSFEAAISSWYESLEKNRERPVPGFSRWLSPFSSVVSRLAAISSASILLVVLFSPRIDDFVSLFRFGLYAAAALMIANLLSIRISNYVENAIQRRRPLSAVLLSDCDRRLLDAQSNQALKSIGSTVAGIAGSIVVGLITAYIAQAIGLS